MKNAIITGGLSAALAGLVLLSADVAPTKPAPNSAPVPAPAPQPAPPKKPKPKPCPSSSAAVAAADTKDAEAKVGGRVAPDGTTGIDCDLPNALHQANIASKGLGCCVFRSLDHAARWQNVPALIHFPEWMKTTGVAGGGYPGKVDALIPKISKARGLPTPAYVQVEAKGEEVLSFMRLASKSGRMISVTYSKSPTGRYGGSKIAHMVNAVHADEKSIVILDNNYIGDTNYEWCTPEEFLKTCNLGGTVWAVVLLEPGPPQPPTQQKKEPVMNRFLAPALACALACAAPAQSRDCCPAGVRKVAKTSLVSGWVNCDRTWVCWYDGGKLTGAWNHDTQEWYPYCHGAWLPASQAPWIGEQQAVGIGANYGVQSNRIGAVAPAKYRLNGRPVNRREAEDAIRKAATPPAQAPVPAKTKGAADGDDPAKPAVPDDSKRMRLTVIGSDAERAPVLADVATSPALAGVRDKVVTKGYDPSNWAVKDYGFSMTGHPTIYLQNPDGTVLFRRDQYDGPADLAERCLRVPDPSYDPAKDSDGSALSVPGGLGGALPLLPPALVFGGLLLFPRGVKLH